MQSTLKCLSNGITLAKRFQPNLPTQQNLQSSFRLLNATVSFFSLFTLALCVQALACAFGLVSLDTCSKKSARKSERHWAINLSRIVFPIKNQTQNTLTSQKQLIWLVPRSAIDFSLPIRLQSTHLSFHFVQSYNVALMHALQGNIIVIYNL